MNTILVDTTIWVDFFHEKERTKQADILQKLIEEENDTHDFIKMSESSLGFWDNEDDKVWDNV